MVPPQVRPASRAVSVDTPYRSRRGSPLVTASRASWMTAFSTHPALTDPAMPPLKVTASLEPTCLGDEPQVSMTVARPIRSPCWRQDSRLEKMSRMVSS